MIIEHEDWSIMMHQPTHGLKCDHSRNFRVQNLSVDFFLYLLTPNLTTYHLDPIIA